VERGRCKFISWYHCCGIDNRFDVLVLAKLDRCSFLYSWLSSYPRMCSSKAWNVRKGGKRSLPFLLAVWGLSGWRFRVSNHACDYSQYMMLRSMTVIPCSYKEEEVP
jgi:hypothetical protein